MAYKIAIIGQFQQGKSTLLNALLAESFADIGEGLPTTHAIGEYCFGKEGDPVNVFDKKSHIPTDYDLSEYLKLDRNKEPLKSVTKVRFRLPKKSLSEIELVDTPGFDASGPDGAADAAIAEAAIDSADFLLLLAPNTQLDEGYEGTKGYIKLIRRCCDSGKPFSVVINCKGSAKEKKWDPLGNDDIVATIQAQIQQDGGAPAPIDGHSPIWTCNAAWAWYASAAVDPSALGGRAKERFDAIHDDLDRHFKGKVDVDQIRQLSRIDPLRDFLTGQGLTSCSVPTLLKLRSAWTDYRKAIVGD